LRGVDLDVKVRREIVDMHGHRVGVASNAEHPNDARLLPIRVLDVR
jgi:hypothetical protein